MSEYHTPVLLDESVTALLGDNPDGVYADATYGGGGHTREILSRLTDAGRVLAFDRDSDAIAGSINDRRLTLIHNNFRFIHNYVTELQKTGYISGFSRQGSEAASGVEEGIDGILADLGVSSHQFDTAERGFSFRFDAPLDMRMNTKSGITAADIVNGRSEEELADIFRIYGEVDNARKVAQLICRARESAPVLTTGQLDGAIEKALPKFAEHKALARIYQALRIEVNQEMKSLEKFLEGAAKSLKKGGRLVVITYHSLEDRMVKNFIKTGNVEGRVEKDIFGNTAAPLKAVNRKPVLPRESEISMNTRARSAKLRIAVKE